MRALESAHRLAARPAASARRRGRPLPTRSCAPPCRPASTRSCSQPPTARPSVPRAAWRGDPAGRRAARRLPAASTAPRPTSPPAPATRSACGRARCSSWCAPRALGKRATARLASLGVNGAGLTVMIAVFASTGGLTGAEVVVAGGTSALSQKVLEAVFGDQAVRTLAARAREQLMARVRTLLDEEALRFERVLAPVTPPAGRARAARRPSARSSERGDRGPARERRRSTSGWRRSPTPRQLARGRLDDERVDAAAAVVAACRTAARARHRGDRRRTGRADRRRQVDALQRAGRRQSWRAPAIAGRPRRPPRPPSGARSATSCSTGSRSPRRHRLAGEPDGLVLLDLPDFDSVELSHRVEVERVVALADLMVWVVDPQKYADAVLHEHYLRPFAAYGEAMVVVLNQADRLDSAARAACVADLGRLLAADGLRGLPVLAVSATTGAGLDALRSVARRPRQRPRGGCGTTRRRRRRGGRRSRRRLRHRRRRERRAQRPRDAHVGALRRGGSPWRDRAR